jgi:hypothetical protein
MVESGEWVPSSWYLTWMFRIEINRHCLSLHEASAHILAHLPMQPHQKSNDLE